MRILVLASTFPRWHDDSVPPFVLHLSAELAKRGHDVHVLAPHANGAKRREISTGVYVHRFRYAPRRASLLCYDGGILENLRRHPIRWLLLPSFVAAQFLSATRLTRAMNIDVIHAHWVLPQGLVAVAVRLLGGRAVVVTAHGGDVFAMSHGWRRRLLSFVCQSADAVTSVSTVLRNAILDSTGVESNVIPMGVDPSTFVDDGKSRNPALYGDAPVVLFVGRLVEKKGVRHLISAMPLVRAAVPGARLVIVGDGPERSLLEELAANLMVDDIVEFQGAVANRDLPGKFREADVFVAPSVLSREGDTEGMPVVLLEAAASGVPIVASRVGGVSDLIRHEETGLLIEPEDPGEIAAAVVRLLGDAELRLSLTKNASERATGHFSWPRIAEAHEDVLASAVLARHGGFDPSRTHEHA